VKISQNSSLFFLIRTFQIEITERTAPLQSDEKIMNEMIGIIQILLKT